ncbi:hypothetical protein DFH28DRAFT_1197470 [Melampsora americana]|nr:hypothetical protein DFH28DRAFT_1197470 [Melampsora americana]
MECPVFDPKGEISILRGRWEHVLGFTHYTPSNYGTAGKSEICAVWLQNHKFPAAPCLYKLQPCFLATSSPYLPPLSMKPSTPSPLSQPATTPRGSQKAKGKPSDSATITPTPPKRNQMSWLKDLNADGKSALDLIVEWLAFTWGDQESPSDAIWMCMESDNLILTNYSAFRSANLSKKECTERCAKYLHAHGFIEQLESKFRAAENWRKATGAGIMETAEDEIAALQADKDVEIDNEEEEAIKATAVKSTNDMLHRLCAYYEALVPIMGKRVGNQPLYTAESSARPNQIKSVTQNTPTQGSPNGSEPQSSIEVQTQSSMVNKTQSSRYAVWEPNDITPPDEFYEPEADKDDAVLNSQSKSCRLNPPAICDPIPKDTPRRASGNATLLNNIRSSLPTQSDFQELNQHYKS